MFVCVGLGNLELLISLDKRSDPSLTASEETLTANLATPDELFKLCLDIFKYILFKINTKTKLAKSENHIQFRKSI